MTDKPEITTLEVYESPFGSVEVTKLPKELIDRLKAGQEDEPYAYAVCPMCKQELPPAARTFNEDAVAAMVELDAIIEKWWEDGDI